MPEQSVPTLNGRSLVKMPHLDFFLLLVFQPETFVLALASIYLFVSGDIISSVGFKALIEMLVRANSMDSLHGALPLSVNVVRPLTSHGACADDGDAIEGYLSRTHPAQRIASNGAVEEDIPIAVATPIPTASATTATEEEYPPMDPKELERLTDPVKGMFKKWARLDTTSAIARFMREGLEPQRRYSSSEILALCAQWKIQLGYITSGSVEKSSNYHYGQIVIKHNGFYRLHPALQTAYHQWL